MLSPRIENVYNGFLSIKKALFSVMEMSNKYSPPCQTMEYMERGDAVSMLVKRGDEFVVIKQFRIGNFIRHGENSSYSNPAGMIDRNETPMDAAVRELKEELGVEPTFIENLGTFFPSCGGSTEQITFFYVEVDEGCHIRPQDSEVHDWDFITEKQYREMIRNNEFKSMQMATAFLLAEEKWCF